MYNSPHAAPPAGPPRAPTVSALKRYPGLRMLATTCLISAWLTLAGSLIGGLVLMVGGGSGVAAATANLSSPTGGLAGIDDDPGSASRSQQAQAATALQTLLTLALPSIRLASGIFTLVTGGTTFLLLLAAGMLVHVILDTEENTRVAAAAMSAVARRMGLGG